ncbi:bifunctional aminotransferase class I/II-fold pyridoxal phosphate-dependent enzyme/GNAT family N-acetyltransferase [Emticicia sp. BO119]|uniref:bifunctional aminotransferase class I/II-fold pyridoxal phosphate-dependent enzyme/GNAT family N-acetyltransferase n=1 Tax=Emticicia sp. BO119 TaxID=2757768 RepID=UPI0015F04792|nr:bifunctional aminotransferase class I/II-fold pyridoxal phosphate-dependent enzyme/GNAT family N-acetyltransferase [Emticicia sp. BO119]MBA4851561.1 GNAT family N-acetyltransferase [Emticicia sp. BO119]
MSTENLQPTEETLDPNNWNEIRALGHQMIDDMIDYLQGLSNKPVWQQPTAEVKEILNRSLPKEGQPAEEIYQEFLSYILPYNKGNIHPRFFAWVQGNGTPLGMLADMLASGMNPNTTIGDHAAMYVEQQVIEWSKEMFGFPESASGLLVSGATMANLTALTTARNSLQDLQIRVKGTDNKLTVYCSAETHICVIKATEVLGIGSERTRIIPVTDTFQINVPALVTKIKEDIEAGFRPFCVVGNAGTVNTGAIDPLEELYQICQEFGLWFHIDGAFGSLAKLTPSFSEKLKTIEKADSLAFDFHKWLHVPYESACVLIRDKKLHQAAFSSVPNYLSAHERGLAAGPEPLTNYGIELSRSFKALKVWMSLKEHGILKYGRLVQQNINQAEYLGEKVSKAMNLELLVPISMNIVCFRFNDGAHTEEALNQLNKEILMRLHESGIAAPSYTIIHGKYAIRANITNHRTRLEDLDLLVNTIVNIATGLLIKVVEFDTSNLKHYQAFKDINYDWINKYFKVEQGDLDSLENPVKYFIATGGAILLACRGDEILGTTALKPIGDDSLELCKMGVSEAARGLGIGYAIGEAAITKAKESGAKRLYLETNSSLSPALNLYKKLGFSQVKNFTSPYVRADVAMEMYL